MASIAQLLRTIQLSASDLNTSLSSTIRIAKIISECT